MRHGNHMYTRLFAKFKKKHVFELPVFVDMEGNETVQGKRLRPKPVDGPLNFHSLADMSEIHDEIMECLQKEYNNDQRHKEK